MNFKERKNNLKKESSVNAEQVKFIAEIRSLALPVKFQLKNIETYNSFSFLELESVENMWIHEDKLKELIVHSMKLHFIFDPLEEYLQQKNTNGSQMYKVGSIVKALHLGEFYRFFPNNQNQLKILINNKTTQLNIKIIIAGILCYALKKLTLDEISCALLLFTLQQSLHGTAPNGIPADMQKMMKALRKIDRIIKPVEFKLWFDNFKTCKNFTEFIQPHHFLYLAAVSQKKYTNGLSGILFKQKSQSYLKNMNYNNMNINDAEKNLQGATQQEQIKIRVKGLSFCETVKRRSFSKQIMKEMRLKIHSKERPNTAGMRKEMVQQLSGHKRSMSFHKMKLKISPYLPTQNQKQKPLEKKRLKIVFRNSSCNIEGLNINIKKAESKLGKQNQNQDIQANDKEFFTNYKQMLQIYQR